MDPAQAERATALVRREVMLETADVPQDEAHSLAGRDLEGAWHEGVLRQRYTDLALGRRSAADRERET
jgi:hypothetical protein